jgi:16S rRNA (uracil1498-N3)-methyltransferase
MITGPEKFPATLNNLIDQYAEGLFLYGDPGGTRFSDVTAIKEKQDVVIIIGPEGGFSEQELDLLTARNACGVMINTNVLRIETAAVAFCTIASLTRL